MQKIICLLLGVVVTGNLLLFQVSAADKGQQTNATEAQEEKETVDAKTQDNLVGAYQQPESPVITDEISQLCHKAFEDMLGAEYEPVALLGTQVVAGTNYRILFICTPVVPDAEGTYSIGYLYEDLQGNVEYTDLVDSSVAADLNDGVGTFVQPENPEITEEVKAVFEKAMEKKTKEEIETETELEAESETEPDTEQKTTYTPVALLSTQVVAGTNYRILCTASNGEKDGDEKYVMLTIYEDLSGDAEVIDSEEIPA